MTGWTGYLSCAHCGKSPVMCKGRYEGMTDYEYSCDECCGHGNEDGECVEVCIRCGSQYPITSGTFCYSCMVQGAEEYR